jgi:hypothetical protein
MMSALMSDVIEGSVSPAVANAAVNAGGKMLKAVELQLKHGQLTGSGPAKCLDLVPNENAPSRDKLLEMREQLDKLLGERPAA